MNVCTGCMPAMLLGPDPSCSRHSRMSSAAVPPVTQYAPDGLTASPCWPQCDLLIEARRSGPCLWTGCSGYGTSCQVLLGTCSCRSLLHFVPTRTLLWSSQDCRQQDGRFSGLGKGCRQHVDCMLRWAGDGATHSMCRPVRVCVGAGHHAASMT